MPGVADNLARVRDQIAASIARRGPGPAVTLIGVGKKQPVAALHAALAAGLHDLGENYAQEFASKHADPLLAALTPRWHFIGALQSNKTRLVVGRAIIHTVDRPSLVTTLAARARALACTQEILVEVNLGGEAQKAGVAPDALPPCSTPSPTRPAPCAASASRSSPPPTTTPSAPARTSPPCASSPPAPAAAARTSTSASSPWA
jgi:uncharacterized pyridoxal phosphate-containing UPF0001 family protein